MLRHALAVGENEHQLFVLLPFSTKKSVKAPEDALHQDDLVVLFREPHFVFLLNPKFGLIFKNSKILDLKRFSEMPGRQE